MTGRPQRAKSRGQSLVETALILPFVVFMIIAVIDLGIAVYGYNTIANAARQGARVAAVNQLEYSTHAEQTGLCVQDRPVQDPGDAYWSIKDCAAYFAVSLGVSASSVDVAYRAPTGLSLTCDPAQPEGLKVGCLVRVSVNYTYAPFTPIVSTIVSSITMSAASEMPIERVFP